MNKLLHVLILIVILISCQKSEKPLTDNTQPITIDVAASIDKAKPTKKFSDIFDITSIIPLQSSERSFIATLSKVIFIDNKVVVLDKKYTSVKVFDKNGSFIRDIVKIGQGPGEFTKVYDMDYSKDDNSISIYSNDDMKLGYFKLDGTLISEKRTPFYSYYFTKISKDSLLFYVNYNSSEYNDENNLLLTDANFSILNKFFPYKRNYVVSSSGSLVKSGGGIYYNDAYLGDIYQFKDNAFKLLYKVNLGKNEIPIERTQTFSSAGKNILDYDNFEKISAKVKDCLIFSFNHDRRSKIGIYYDNKKQIYISNDFEKNDVYHIISPPKNKEDDDSTFYTVISPVTLGYIKDNANFFEDLKENYPVLFPYLKNLKDTDNPIILCFKRK